MTGNPSPAGGDAAGAPTQSEAMLVAIYTQNSENFRSLNSLMWQIPLIGMTLTGGLWFGVASVSEDPVLRSALLGLACVGNVALAVILHRLRFVMQKYLEWLQSNANAGFVDATGQRLFTKNKVVRSTFQTVLLLAALISLLLLIYEMSTQDQSASQTTVEWYDEHAEELADRYEGIDPLVAHPHLFDLLAASPNQSVLDIGAGTGRDAAAIAKLGHSVTAIEPSQQMLSLAQRLHQGSGVKWRRSELPELEGVTGEFDVIILSAVWMHIPAWEREEALSSLLRHLKADGAVYMTLRDGPADGARSIYAVDTESLNNLARHKGLSLEILSQEADLLGRSEVNWVSVMLTRPSDG